MVQCVIANVKKWFVTKKYELLGFALGMVVVVIAAGIYRISWEFPAEESGDTKASTVSQPASAASKIPAPNRAARKAVAAPQAPMRARPVLRKLDAPPEALRRQRVQQNTTAPPANQ